MDARLEDALRPVFADLTRSGVGLPTLDDTNWTQSADSAAILLTTGDGTMTGISIMLAEEVVCDIPSVADQVQEFVHESIQWPQGTPVAWPGCPLHPGTHPLAPRVGSAGAIWVCPTTDQAIAEIGSLGAGQTS